MRNLTELWQAYDNGIFGKQELKDLSWHIENDKDPTSSISIATDIGSKHLGSVIAKHLDHPDWSVREFTLGCLLGRLKISEYGEKAFSMATSDTDQGVKSTAISCLGSVLDNLDKYLQQKIASYIYSIIVNKESYHPTHFLNVQRIGICSRESAAFRMKRKPRLNRDVNDLYCFF